MSAAEARLRAFPAQEAGTTDAVLEELISSVDASIAGWCGYPRPDSGQPTMLAAAYTVYLDGPWSQDPRVLLLPIRPVNSITSVAEDGAGNFGWSTTVASTSYVLDGQRGELLRIGGAWTRGLRYTKVVLNAGFSDPDDDLLQGAALAVRYLYDARRRLGVQTTGNDVASESYQFEPAFTSWPQEIRRLLGRFRLPEVGLG